MLPKLFNSFDLVSATGPVYPLGTISHCRKCLVKEERNGEYTLELETTVNDPTASKLISQRIIRAKPDPDSPEQCFEIQTSKRVSNSLVKVQAKHVRNFLYQLESKGDIGYTDELYSYSLTPAEVWSKLFNNGGDPYITDTCPFVFGTNIVTKKPFYLGFNEPKLLGAIIGGETGSMLDTYGGELSFNNYSVYLHSSRGQNTNYELRYGKNISSAEQSESCTQAYSHIRPYGQVAYGSRQVMLYADTFEIPGNECRTKKVFLLDCTEALRTVQINPQSPSYTEARALMTAYATQYAAANDIGKTNVSITVDTRARLDSMQHLRLCDTVKVYLDNYGVSTTAKIVSVTYNSLLERWESMTVGMLPIRLSDILTNRKRFNL